MEALCSYQTVLVKTNRVGITIEEVPLKPYKEDLLKQSSLLEYVNEKVQY